MTQIFDPETGAVTRRDRDRGRPVPGRPGEDGRRPTATTACSSPSTRFADWKVTLPELGHLKRFGVGAAPDARRVPRRRSTAPSRARRSRSRSSSRATRSRSPGSGSARASRARSSATTSRAARARHGSHNVRAPGSVGASATPSRVFKGVKLAGPDGRQARHPARADRPQVDPEQNLLLVKGSVPGPEERARRGARLMAAPKAPVLDAKGGNGEGRLARGGRLRRRGQAAPRPRGRARRAERAARRHVRDEEPRARLRRPLEAVAPEGHGPRPRRHHPRRAVHRRRSRRSRRCRAAST